MDSFDADAAWDAFAGVLGEISDVFDFLLPAYGVYLAVALSMALISGVFYMLTGGGWFRRR